MNENIEKIFLSEMQINEIALRLSKKINKDYAGKNPVFVCVLKGAMVFFSDLIKKIELDCTLEFIKVKSYVGTESSGNISIDKVPDVKDKDVIIVEDILDTGRTLLELKNLFLNNGALSVEICALLNKPDRRKYDIYAKYIGSNIDDEFVVGYGLDYNERFRNLPYVGILKEEVYKG